MRRLVRKSHDDLQSSYLPPNVFIVTNFIVADNL